MGKRRGRAAGLALALVLLFMGLAGCADTKGDAVGNTKPGGSEEAQENAGGNGGDSADAFSDDYGGKGRFLEKELTLPEAADHVIAAEKLSDGSITAIGYNANSMQYYLMNTKDMGESWDSKDIQGMNMFYVANAAIAPDGSAILTDPYGKEVAIVSPEGTASAGSLTMPQGNGSSENQVQQMAYTADGRLILLDLNGDLYRTDVSVGTLERLSKDISEEVYYFGIAGNDVIAVLGSGVYCLNGETGEVEADDTLKQVMDSSKNPIASENNYPYLFAAGAEENSVIYVSHEGLFFHQMGGSVNEQLINGALVSLGDNSLGLIRAITVDDETYLVLGSDSLGKPRFYRYTYDAEASAVPEKQLKVYALEDSIPLQQAITYFQKQNPDVFVKKTIGLSGGDGITAEDALRTLSTDIMSGNGPDVLILDGIPVESYIEKGILADIKGLIEEVESADGLFENIKEAYIRNGSIYEIPSRFCFSVAEGEGEIPTESLPAFMDYAKGQKTANPDTGILVPMSVRGLLHELYYADSAGWQKEDGSLDEERVKLYLTAAKEWHEMDSYPAEEYNDQVENYSFRFGGLYGSSGNLANFRMCQKGTAAIGTIASIDDVQTIHAIEKQAGGKYQVFGEEGGSFMPYVSVGIAAGSAENQDAQNFVKGLLGKECQSASATGFPINRAAYQEHLKNQKTYSMGTSMSDGTSVGYEAEVLTEEQAAFLKKQIEGLKRPALADRVIQDLVVDEGEKCLNGSQSVEDAVTAIMQKVKLYLSE